MSNRGRTIERAPPPLSRSRKLWYNKIDKQGNEKLVFIGLSPELTVDS